MCKWLFGAKTNPSRSEATPLAPAWPRASLSLCGQAPKCQGLPLTLPAPTVPSATWIPQGSRHCPEGPGDPAKGTGGHEGHVHLLRPWGPHLTDRTGWSPPNTSRHLSQQAQFTGSPLRLPRPGPGLITPDKPVLLGGPLRPPPTRYSSHPTLHLLPQAGVRPPERLGGDRNLEALGTPQDHGTPNSAVDLGRHKFIIWL